MTFKAKKLIALAVVVFTLGCIGFTFLSAPWLFGINNADQRTVIQHLNGTLRVKFTPGWYTQFYGTVTEYGHYMTYDFTAGQAVDKPTMDTDGIAVRYRDGGTGTVHGKVRFRLPEDPETMLALHQAFKSHKGVASKLILPVVQEAANMTAGLLTSEGAYNEERAVFTKWMEEQIRKGKFETDVKTEIQKDEVTGKSVAKRIPVIAYEGGQPKHLSNDLGNFGISLASIQIVDWNFEKKTLEQIANKRKATMAIVTAKAEAEKAKQDAITIEEQGRANVMKARYEMQVEKEKAIVNAERQKEVAEIKAAQQVAVAAQNKLEAEQMKLRAAEIKQEQILLGEGEAERKRLVMEADGALAQKLETYRLVMEQFAVSFGQQKWTPEIVLGGSDSGVTGSNVNDMITLLTTKVAKDLALDTAVQ